MDDNEIYDLIIGCLYLRHLCNHSSQIPGKITYAFDSLSSNLLEDTNFDREEILDLVSGKDFMLNDKQLVICKVVLDEVSSSPYISNDDAIFVNYANDIMLENTKRIRDIKISKLTDK